MQFFFKTLRINYFAEIVPLCYSPLTYPSIYYCLTRTRTSVYRILEIVPSFSSLIWFLYTKLSIFSYVLKCSQRFQSEKFFRHPTMVDHSVSTTFKEVFLSCDAPLSQWMTPIFLKPGYTPVFIQISWHNWQETTWATLFDIDLGLL